MPKICLFIVTMLGAGLMFADGADFENGEVCLRLTVTSGLPFANVPMDPVIDFPGYIEEAGFDGVLDPNSIRVVDVSTGEGVPCAITEDFAYGDKGRVEWVIKDPGHTVYDIRFRVVKERLPLIPSKYAPLIGVGDLLRFNAGEPRRIMVSYPSRLVDLTGDGKPDLVGCWNYAYRPGWPLSGIVCYPRMGSQNHFEFGDLVRVRYVDAAGSRDFKHFTSTYMTADFADLNKDGLVDVVYSPNGGDAIHVYLNSGTRDAGGLPVFVTSGRFPRHTSAWSPCRAVDLDDDGAIDVVVGSMYLRNTNPKGWPISLAEGVNLDLTEDTAKTAYLAHCFFDVDVDGVLDAVCLAAKPSGDVHDYRVMWRKNLGGDPLAFGAPEPVQGIDVVMPGYLAALTDGPHKGLLVLHDVYQSVSFYEQVGDTSQFRYTARAMSDSAVMSLSDQAWPYICDWDGDGDWDLLVGGGYGWPRIVINEGTSTKPAFAKPQPILANGKPIRILRDEVFGTKYWHNMGYPLPAYVDWDGDSLPDLMLPNETNRIFWYKNVGTRQRPEFGERRQLLPDGYFESPEALARSVKRIEEQDTPYPLEKNQPFFWRTGAAFGDWNDDGLTDLVTHDGATRKATLFVQYRDASDALHLRKEYALTLADGRLIDDTIVARSKHWTESFRAADWDGDGLTDLIYSCAGTEAAKGSIYFLRNCGDKTKPVFENPVTLSCFSTPISVSSHGPHPAVGDIDGDGKPDLVTCVEWSVYPFYSHAAVTLKERPTYEITLAQ